MEDFIRTIIIKILVAVSWLRTNVQKVCSSINIVILGLKSKAFVLRANDTNMGTLYVYDTN